MSAVLSSTVEALEGYDAAMRELVLSAVLMHFACGGSPENRNGDDAAPEVVDAAGGEDADGAAPDAGADAQLPELPSAYECDVNIGGTVAVRTSPNITLLIHDVFGTFKERITSDASGNANATVPGCGSVTAVFPSGFETVTHVRSGDQLSIARQPWDPPPTQGPIELYIDEAVPGATSYAVAGPVIGGLIGTDPTERYLQWNARSLDAQGLTTLAVHASGTPAYAVFDNVDLSSFIGHPIRVSSWITDTVTFQLSAMLSQPVEVLNVTFANATNGNFYVPQYDQRSAPSTSSNYVFELPDYGDDLYIHAYFGSQSTGMFRSLTQVIAKPSASDITLELTDHTLLPEVTSMSVTPSATSRPTLSWTFGDATDIQGDLMLLNVRGSAGWLFVLPPGLTTFRLPELPADLAQDFTTLHSYGLRVQEDSNYAGYSQARCRYIETMVGGILSANYPRGRTVRMSTFGDAP